LIFVVIFLQKNHYLHLWGMISLPFLLKSIKMIKAIKINIKNKFGNITSS